jgi:hypothetical protein
MPETTEKKASLLDALEYDPNAENQPNTIKKESSLLNQLEFNPIIEGQKAYRQAKGDKEEVKKQIQQSKKDVVETYQKMGTNAEPLMPSEQKKGFVSGILRWLGKAASYEHAKDFVMMKDQNEFVKFLTTPIGSYYAQAGAKLNSDTVMEWAGVPETLPLDPRLKYPPQVLTLINATGADVNKMKDRIALSMFIDTLAANGFNKVANVFNKLTGGEATRFGKKLANMSDEALTALESEMRLTSEVPKIPIQSSESIPRMSPKKAAEQLAANPDLMGAYVDDTILAGKKVSLQRNGSTEIIKDATSQDKFNQLLKDSLMTNDPDEVWESFLKQHGATDDLLPPIGKPDLPKKELTRTGIWTAVRSPQYYCPSVWEKVMDHQATKAALNYDYAKYYTPFTKLRGKPEDKIIGMVLDGHPESAQLMTKLSEDGIKFVDEFRKMTTKIADQIGIPLEKRITNYFHHWWRDISTKKEALEVPEQLRLWANINKNPLKKRVGYVGYEMSAVDTAEKYATWASQYIATKLHRTEIFNMVKVYKELDPNGAGKMAEMYALNFFGELEKVNAPKAVKGFLSEVKRRFVQATLGYNFTAAIRNVTEPFIFGAQEIGYNALRKGIAQFSKMKLGSAEAKEIERILQSSGVLENRSKLEFMKEGGAAWREIIRKKVETSKVLNAAKVTVDKIVDHAFDFMDKTETFNKGIVYLGARQDILEKLNVIKQAGKGKFPSTEKWLQNRGINPFAEDIEYEAHKYARLATVKTIKDHSRAGQNLIAMNPIASIGYTYASFPVKSSEYVLHNAKATIKYMMKSPIGALAMPETRATLRLAGQLAVGVGVAHATGVTLWNVLGIGNFVPSPAPILQVGIRLSKYGIALTNEDPIAGQQFTRSLLTLLGLPVNAPLWKVVNLFKTVDENMKNKSKSGDWVIRNPRTNRPMYEVDPGVYLMSWLTGITKSESEEEYYNSLRDKQNLSKKQKNISLLIQQSIEARDYDKARKYREEMKETRKKRMEITRTLRELTEERR